MNNGVKKRGSFKVPLKTKAAPRGNITTRKSPESETDSELKAILSGRLNKTGGAPDGTVPKQLNGPANLNDIFKGNIKFDIDGDGTVGLKPNKPEKPKTTQKPNLRLPPKPTERITHVDSKSTDGVTQVEVAKTHISTEKEIVDPSNVKDIKSRFETAHGTNEQQPVVKPKPKVKPRPVVVQSEPSDVSVNSNFKSVTTVTTQDTSACNKSSTVSSHFHTNKTVVIEKKFSSHIVNTDGDVNSCKANNEIPKPCPKKKPVLVASKPKTKVVPNVPAKPKVTTHKPTLPHSSPTLALKQTVSKDTTIDNSKTKVSDTVSNDTTIDNSKTKVSDTNLENNTLNSPPSVNHIVLKSTESSSSYDDVEIWPGRSIGLEDTNESDKDISATTMVENIESKTSGIDELLTQTQEPISSDKHSDKVADSGNGSLIGSVDYEDVESVDKDGVNYWEDENPVPKTASLRRRTNRRSGHRHSADDMKKKNRHSLRTRVSRQNSNPERQSQLYEDIEIKMASPG